MKLSKAQKVAESLAGVLSPHCERVSIAGSVRRQKSEVKDIELVLIPDTEWTTDLFGEPDQKRNLLYDAVHKGIKEKYYCVEWIKPGTDKITPWHIKPDGKYWRGNMYPAGGLPVSDASIKVDIFLATPQNWGAIFLIRTGSADFSQAVVTHALRVGYKFDEGFLTCRGHKVETPDEQTVFDRLGLQYIEPQNRLGIESLRAKVRK